MTSSAGRRAYERASLQRRRVQFFVLRAAFLILLVAAAPAMAQEPQPQPTPGPEAQPAAQFNETVEVVAVTPIHGLGVPKSKVAANIQVFAAPREPALAPADAAGLLAERATSVHLTDAQGGTFQPDLLFRGFSGSSLLGSSEGLAVYQNGVRMNEAFGDTVSWDALPTDAVASLNVIPGSNPLFGLNALGGALSIQTKDGFGAAGHRFSARAGSLDRYDMDVESGGHGGRFGYYLAGSLTDDNGWRDQSPSTLRRLFGDAAWRGAFSQVNVSFTGASNDLIGNGPAPEALLLEDRGAIFTYPDRTDNDVAMVSANYRIVRNSGHFDGVGYYRHVGLRTFNGDNAGDDAEGGFDAINNRSHTRTAATGVSGQFSRDKRLAGRENTMVVGAALDSAATRFDFSSEWAHLTSDRGTVGSGLFDEDAAVDLHSRTSTASAFATNIWSATSRLAATVSARFNWTAVRLRDQIGADLTGDHTFGRLNPAAGLTFQATPHLNVYGSYTQSSRVPTPVELTCADPEDPCRLPNAFLSDPPLDQIVASTWEVGARGGGGALSWTLSAYHTAANDDIIFVSSGTLRGQGHFDNVARTVRRGVEAGLTYDRAGRLSAFASYTLQAAVFGTDLVIASRFHPFATDAGIPIAEGSTLPGIPTHSFKAGLSGRLTPALDAGFTVRSQSSQYLRGDEANLLLPAPGFAVADAHARYRVNPRLSLVAQVTNLFDSRYYTFGVLGDASLIDEALAQTRFYSPGAPRGAAVEVEVRF
jgi:iron complex outermembrane receptor protein